MEKEILKQIETDLNELYSLIETRKLIHAKIKLEEVIDVIRENIDLEEQII